LLAVWAYWSMVRKVLSPVFRGFRIVGYISPVAVTADYSDCHRTPEKVNSILWVRRGKDTLAFANITGAMVFQGTLLPAIGIMFTLGNRVLKY